MNKITNFTQSKCSHSWKSSPLATATYLFTLSVMVLVDHFLHSCAFRIVLGNTQRLANCHLFIAITRVPIWGKSFQEFQSDERLQKRLACDIFWISGIYSVRLLSSKRDRQTFCCDTIHFSLLLVFMYFKNSNAKLIF